MTLGMTRHLTEETLGEVVHELDISTVGLNAEVYRVMYGRDKAVDIGLDVRTVVGDGVNVYLFFLLVPGGMGIEHTHAPLFELEVVDAEVGLGGELAEERRPLGLTSGLAAELYGVEIDKVEDVGNLHFVEVGSQRIRGVAGCHAVDDDVLLSPMHGKVIYEQVVVVVEDVGRLHIPGAVVQNDVGGLDAQVGFRLIEEVLVESYNGVELPAHVLLRVVVVPTERGCDVVVGSICQQADVHALAVVHQFLKADVAFQGVSGRSDADAAVGVP